MDIKQEKGKRHNRWQSLLSYVQSGIPVTSQELRTIGVLPDSVKHYVRQGYLKKLAHGLYALPNDEISLYGAIKCLCKTNESLHVASKTALEWHGIVHNLYSHQECILFNTKTGKSPLWSENFGIRYTKTALFDLADRDHLTYPACLARPLELPCSVPERAVLEMLYEVGKSQDFEEAQNIFDGFFNPRMDVLGNLLQHCRSFKVIRLFAQIVRERNLFDVDRFYKQYKISTGSNFTWSIKTSDGTYLRLKP